MSEYDRLMRVTRWCAWMVYPALTFCNFLPSWVPYSVRALPLRAVCKLFAFHLVVMRYAGYGDA